MAQKNTKELFILTQLEKGEDDSLSLFLSKMAKFDKSFCDAMASGSDFTIRLEVRGDKGKLVHCRVYSEEIARPIKGDKPKSNQDLDD